MLTPKTTSLVSQCTLASPLEWCLKESGSICNLTSSHSLSLALMPQISDRSTQSTFRELHSYVESLLASLKFPIPSLMFWIESLDKNRLRGMKTMLQANRNLGQWLKTFHSPLSLEPVLTTWTRWCRLKDSSTLATSLKSRDFWTRTWQRLPPARRLSLDWHLVTEQLITKRSSSYRKNLSTSTMCRQSKSGKQVLMNSSNSGRRKCWPSHETVSIQSPTLLARSRLT